jgi:hypothetical protein
MLDRLGTCSVRTLSDSKTKIRRYLEVYTSKTARQSRKAQMTDIDLVKMRFSCGGQGSVIPFDPPLKSLRQARERLVQMDEDCLHILGDGGIFITQYVPPYAKLGHLINFSQCLLVYLLLPREANFTPGSLLYDNVLVHVPALADFILQIRWYLLPLMVGIHLAEASIMAKKLSKHALTYMEPIWWLWVGSSFVEGITSFWRLNSWIEKKRAKKH